MAKDELIALRRDQTEDNKANKYLDEPYHASRVYKLEDIDVPVLSVANLGGILLHLRGNVVGYLEAGTKNKWLYFISGRHDLPFYLPHFVELQKSFLDAWLKGEDSRGWTEGPNVKVPAVSLLVRKGNPGFNKTEYEQTFAFRDEKEWPLARTRYTKFHLQPDLSLSEVAQATEAKTLELEALGKSDPIMFTATFDAETEIAGHPTVNLVYSVARRADGTAPKDLDVFVTLRHLDAEGKEIMYTGTAGDPVPLAKGGWYPFHIGPFSQSNSLPFPRQAGSVLPSAPSMSPPRVTGNGSRTESTNPRTSPSSSRTRRTASSSRSGRRRSSSVPAGRLCWRSRRVTVRAAGSFCITSRRIGMSCRRGVFGILADEPPLAGTRPISGGRMCFIWDQSTRTGFVCR